MERSLIRHLWDQQNGRCALSGRPMTWGRIESDIQGDSDNLSIDRIDSRRGYVSDNVHLVTARVNLMKRDYAMDEFIRICQDVAVQNNSTSL